MSASKTLFVVNPVSGGKNKTRVVKEIEKNLDPGLFDFDINYTRGPGHASDLTKTAVDNGIEVVVAVGGDGTVNEVATGLVHSNATLGIIPVGSGNGLARHLQIPMNYTKAVQILNESGKTTIDICTANDIPFFNVAGLGYDAIIAHDFAKSEDKGFISYLQSVVAQWFKYRPKKFTIKTEDRKYKTKALLISLANGSQLGNNAYIAPDARIDDGLMDVSILYNFPGLAAPIVAFQLFSKSINRSRYSETLRLSEVTIKQKGKKAHLDGEPFKLGKKIHFKVLPGALNILAPKVYLDERPSEYTLSQPR